MEGDNKYICTFRLFVGIVLLSICKGVPYQGCYKETLPFRTFIASAGTYDPAGLNVQICREACFSLMYDLAALTNGNLCFCGASVGSAVVEADGNCVSPCPGLLTDNCGSTTHASVWKTPTEINIVTLTTADTGSAPQKVFSTAEDVQFTTTVVPSSVTNALITFDYEDTGSISETVNYVHTRSYLFPGRYTVTAWVTDSESIISPMPARAQILVAAPPDDVLLECDNLYYPTNEELWCTATIRGGDHLDAAVAYGDSSTESMSLNSPEWSTAGFVIPRTLSSPNSLDVGSKSYVQRMKFFQNDGELVSIEYYVTATGPATFSLLRPSCSYCSVTNLCSACTVGQKTCAGASYCPKNGGCSNSCNTPINFYTTPPSDFTVVKTFPVTFSTLGWGSLDVRASLTTVSPGDVIAYTTTAAGQLATRALEAGEISDKENSVALIDGAPVSGIGLWSDSNSIHYFRAIAAEPTRARLFHTYVSAGTYSITADAKSRYLTTVVSNGTEVILQDKITPLDLVCPTHLSTTVSHTLTSTSHTGTDITYTWYINEVEVTNTTLAQFTNTYPNQGINNVTVKAWNKVSEQWASCEITLEDPVTDVQALSAASVSNQAASFHINMTSGTQYECTWSWGDGASDTVTYEGNTPITGSDHTHTYTSAGTYTVSMTCANNISTDTITITHSVHDPITGISLVSTGALRAVASTPSFTYLTGSSPSFTLTIDGTTYPVSASSGDPLVWETIAPVTFTTTGLFDLVITGVNLVSSVTFNANFTVDSPIKNPTSTVSATQINTGESVSYNVSMTEGTSVQVDWYYMDGTVNDTHSMGTLETWPSGSVQTRVHQFNTPGIFNVTVRVKNNYNDLTYFHLIYVLNTVEHIVMSSNAPVAFSTGGSWIYFTFAPVSTAPQFAPTMAVVSFTTLGSDEFSVANLQNLPYGASARAQIGSNKYTETGVYTVTANVSNPISSIVVTITVAVVVPITSFSIKVTPEHAPVNTDMTISATVEIGSGVTYVTSWGDGTPDTSHTRTGSHPWAYDVITHRYTSVGLYMITVIASNAVGNTTKTYKIAVQHPVTTDFAFMNPSGPTLYTDTTTSPVPVTLRLTYLDSIATPLPTDAQYVIEWGDGEDSGQANLTFGAAPYVKDLTHNYQGPGDWKATIKIWNLASSQTFMASAGIYSMISGTTVVAKYRRSIPSNGPYMVGVNGGKTFPLHLPVAFFISAGTGIPAMYLVEATKVGGGAIHTCNSTTNPATIQFTQVGEYIVTAQAWTPLNSETQTLRITLADDVTDIALENPQQVIKPRKRTSVNFTLGTVNTAACAVINFGDDKDDDTFICGTNCTNYPGYPDTLSSQSPTCTMNNPITLSYKYKKIGYYNVSISVFTPFGQTSAYFPITVSKKDCQNPLLSFKEASADFLNPTHVYRSGSYLVTTITTCVCSSCLNSKKWTIFQIDEYNGIHTKTIDMSVFSSYNKPDMYIGALSLEYGVYQLNYQVTMDVTPFQTTVSAYVRITASPLKPAIVAGGMSSVTAPWKSTITITPKTYSKDPDVRNIITKRDLSHELDFIIYCKQQFEDLPKMINGSLDPDTTFGSTPYSDQLLKKAYATDDFTGIADDGGCFRQGPGVVEKSANSIENTGEITFSGLNMLPNESYVFVVEVMKGDRYASTRLQLDVSLGNPPSLQIRCKEEFLCRPDERGVWFNSNVRLRLIASCNERCVGVTSYKWDFYRLGLNEAWLPISDQEDYIEGTYGQNSPEISVNPEMFNRGFAYLAELTQYRVTVRALGSDGSTGESSTNIHLNKPPTAGTCSVTDMGDTRRLITCQGFFDPDGISTYILLGQYAGEKYPRTLGYFEDREMERNLPYGAYNDDFNIHFYVKVLDIFGAFVITDLGTHRIAPSVSDYDAVLNSLHDEDSYQKVTNEGDIQETTAQLLSYAAILNAESRDNRENEFRGYGIPPYDENPYVDPNYTKKELRKKLKQYEIERDRNANLRSDMIAATGNLTTVGNITSLQLVADTMEQLVAEPGELNRDAQKSATKWVVNAMKELQTMADEISLDDLRVAADSLFNVMGGILQATEINSKYPTKSDIKAAKKSGYFKYYTTYYTDRKPILRPDAGDDTLGYESSGLVQNQTTASVVPDVLASIELLTAMILDKMVPTEGALTLSSDGMDVYMDKDQATDILGRTLTVGDAASLDLPEYCTFTPAPCNPLDTVSIVVTSVGPQVYSYLDSDGIQVPPGSNVLVLDLYDADGKKISLKNADPPINLTINHDGGMDVPQNLTTVKLSANLTIQHMFCRSVTVDHDTAILFEVVPQDPDIRVVILIRFGDFPSLINHEYHHYEYSPPSLPNTVPKTPVDQYLRAHSLFLSNKNVTHFRKISGSDKMYMCFRRLNSTNATELHMTGPPAINVESNDVTEYNVSTRITLVSCTYVDVQENGVPIWSTANIWVAPMTTVNTTICSSSHLSSFSTGWAVQPNAIDFDYVFDNLDFFKNPTLYVAEIVVLIIYICFFIWARHKDIKDTERRGVTPLPDNDPTDSYYYEITVQTGIRKNAATDSKVHFILSGEYDETDVRVFEDRKRKIFRRGALDSFLMTTERPLGPLSYARVWHDNTGKGKYESWYLNYIIVHDLQTKERYFFIANEWFAVEESDGQVDRLLPLSGPEQMQEVGHLLANSATKKLGDDHIWFSVVARPPESRFTRLQRLSCCLCLLFTSMLANAMYYETLASGAGQNALTFGPFSLTPEQIYVGVISNLVVFPVNFLIVTLFRKSRPRKKRNSRLMEAIRENERNYREQHEQSEPTNSRTDLDMFTASTSDLDTKTDDPNRVPTPVGETAEMTKPLEPSVQGLSTDQKPAARSTTLQVGETKPKKKKAFSLPWWFRIVSWVILWIATLLSATFVTFYGVQFGDDKTRKWITSLVVSFLTSIFLTQPIKVFLVALLFSLIFKKSDLIDEVAEEDEEDLQLGDDENWLHPTPGAIGTGGFTRRERKLAYSPPDPELLREARENRLKEVRMYDIMREILFYAMFLWVLLVISYGFRDPNAFYMKRNIQSTLVDLGLSGHGASENSFVKMRKMSDFWSWCENTMIPALRADKWYNGDQPYGQRGFIHDRVSRLMGYAVIRQLRIEKNQCDTVKKMRPIIPECYTPYSLWSEDKADYGVGWVPFVGDANKNNSGDEWRYRGSLEMEGWPFIGSHAVYNGGGYVVELKEHQDGLKDKFARLERDGWIDRETRAIFIEHTVYNAQVNLFGITTFIAEFLNSGGIQTYTRVEPMNLLGYGSGAQLFQIICQILFLCFILFFIIKEIRKVVKQKKEYFYEPWNYIEVSIILLSLGGTVIYFYRMLKSKELVARFAENQGNSYMKFQYVAYWNELLLYMLGWLVFLASVKFIRLLRFNKRMSLLAQTLRHGAKPLMMFGIMFSLVFFAFAQFFYFVYFMELTNFSNIIYAAETCMQMLIGKFNFNAMQGASPVLGPLFFFCYVVTVYYILINMFLTILNDSFSCVRRDIELQSNEYEMVDFFVKRFSQWTGIGGSKAEKKTTKDVFAPDYVEGRGQMPLEEQIDNFPERVDRLMDTISKVFLDQNTFESMFMNSNKARSKEAMKMMMKKSPERYTPPSDMRY